MYISIQTQKALRTLEGMYSELTEKIEINSETTGNCFVINV